jgi:hypothetical protein
VSRRIPDGKQAWGKNPLPKQKPIVGTTRVILNRFSNEFGDTTELAAHFGELYPGECVGDCEYVVFRMFDPSDNVDYEEEFVVEISQLEALIAMAKAWNRMLLTNERSKVIDAEAEEKVAR